MTSKYAFDPVVATTSGRVRGIWGEYGDTAGLLTWRGVPFGADTAGSARFRAPRPAPSWGGVREAAEFGPAALQPTYTWTDRVIGSEDCLNLDIVRPNHADTRPVVVYLHGGSFLMGASHEQMLRGYHLVATMDVVYVSVNFRLGALGYLDLHTVGDDCVANPAVLDQLLALRWVRANIAAFGGDPDNVTLMGESAGGAAVVTLMAVPAAEGLFHKAIAQSSPLSAVHSPVQSKMWARDLVYRMALPRSATLADLRAESGGDIVRAGQAMMFKRGELKYLNSSYAPTVDGELIPVHPIEAFEAGTQSKVPLIIGTNLDETSFSKFIYQRTSSRSRAAERILSVFDPEHSDGILEAYQGATTRQDFAELLADAVFWAPSMRVAEAHAVDTPTWMYRFDYSPKALKWLGLGAMHSMDLSVIFGDPGAHRASTLHKVGGMEGYDEVSEVMQRHWSHFFHHSETQETWPAYESGTEDQPGRTTLILDGESRLVHGPKESKRQAWMDFDMTSWGVGRPTLLAELGLGANAYEL